MSKPSQSYRFNTRRFYERHHNIKIPDGYEIHHSLPKRLGGTDEIENLVMLTVEEHKAAHMKLYLEYGDYRDLCAYHMIGGNFTEAQKIASSNGGKKAAQLFKERGQQQGFQAFDSDYQRECASAGGKIGGRKQVKLKIGIHSQTPEERLIVASAGGKKGSQANGWNDSKIQSENGKKGGPKNKGFKWYNDGVSDLKYTLAQQLLEPFEVFLERTNLRAGRIPSTKRTCPHCGKTGNTGPMSKWHFNNCKAFIYEDKKH